MAQPLVLTHVAFGTGAREWREIGGEERRGDGDGNGNGDYYALSVSITTIFESLQYLQPRTIMYAVNECLPYCPMPYRLQYQGSQDAKQKGKQSSPYRIIFRISHTRY